MIWSKVIGAGAHRGAVVDRRLLLLGLTLAGIEGTLCRAEESAQSNEAALGKAIGALAHEKSAAEVRC